MGVAGVVACRPESVWIPHPFRMEHHSQLLKAVRHGDTIQLRRLLADGGDPNEAFGIATILAVATARRTG